MHVSVGDVVVVVILDEWIRATDKGFPAMVVKQYGNNGYKVLPIEKPNAPEFIFGCDILGVLNSNLS